MQKGILYMASSHLGNPDDLSLRVLETLKICDVLIFEEDRPARLVLKKAGLTRDYLKYSEHNEIQVLKQLKTVLKSGGSVIYMSDQGCPSFEDPGLSIIQSAYEVKASIRVIPGPSSLTAALMACPFYMPSFQVKGRPPVKANERQSFFSQLRFEPTGMIFLDTPYRLERIAQDCHQHFNPKRRFHISLQLTLSDEEHLTGTCQDIIEILKPCFKHKKLFVLIIAPS